MREDLGEGFEEEVAAFLGVEAAEEEEEGFGCAVGVGESGVGGEEGGDEGGGVGGRGGCAVGDDAWGPAGEGEALAGEAGLGLRGEEDETGAAEEMRLGEEPVGGLFEVLEGVGVAEPGVEHAVGEDGVGFLFIDSGYSEGDAGVLPEAVEDDSVVVREVGAEPGEETRGEGVAGDATIAEGGAEGVDGEFLDVGVLEEGGGGGVEGEGFTVGADGGVGG